MFLFVRAVFYPFFLLFSCLMVSCFLRSILMAYHLLCIMCFRPISMPQQMAQQTQSAPSAHTAGQLLAQMSRQNGSSQSVNPSGTGNPLHGGPAAGWAGAGTNVRPQFNNQVKMTHLNLQPLENLVEPLSGIVVLVLSSRWLHRQLRPCRLSFPPWEGLEVIPPPPLAKCRQVLLQLKPTEQTIQTWPPVPASAPTVMVGRPLQDRSNPLSSCATALCSAADGSQSGAQFPSRAAEAVWPQWQGQQGNAEQHPHAQGSQQDMFPVSPSESLLKFSPFFFFLISAFSLMSNSGYVVYPGPAGQLQQQWLWDSPLPSIQWMNWFV